ncbi:MAG: endonuclease domain-containing protein [Mycobacteriaceae bacterium]
MCSSCRAASASRAAHARRLKALYDITIEEYEALLERQGHRCAMCGGTRRYRLNVDHDHKVEKEKGVRASVRGLLCRRCNKLLRDARDNTSLLIAAITYLTAWPSKGVIT